MDLTETSSLTVDQLRLVLDVSRLLAVTADLDTLLTRIAKSATSLMNAERASIFLHDSNTGELWTRVALGAKEIRVPDTSGICGHVFHSNQLLNVPRPYDDPRFNRDVDRRNAFVTRNLLTVPARDMTRNPIGVLQVVNRIGGEFLENDEAMIEILADQVGVAIQRHYLHEEVVKTAGLRHEMELAQKVQAAMIPQQPPAVAGLSCVGWTLPASMTGGDSYDLWQMPDGRLGIFLGDASGHGIAPAIVVSQARTLVRSLAEINCDPNWLLDRINARLCADLEPGRFVTVFLGCMCGDGQLRWSSAGHGPMFLRPRLGAPVELLEPKAPPIGVTAQLAPEPLGSVQLEGGGMLAVLSDGLFEARNPAGELLEVQPLVDLMNRHSQSSPQQILATLQGAVRQWQGKLDPADDQTVVIVQRN